MTEMVKDLVDLEEALMRREAMRMRLLVVVVGRGGAGMRKGGDAAAQLVALISGSRTGSDRSCSSPRWDNLPSGHQRHPLKGLNLGYMYWDQKHSSE